MDVSNIGKRAGNEVIQLYVRDPEPSLTRPVQELRGVTARTHYFSEVSVR